MEQEFKIGQMVMPDISRFSHLKSYEGSRFVVIPTPATGQSEQLSTGTIWVRCVVPPETKSGTGLIKDGEYSIFSNFLKLISNKDELEVQDAEI